MWRNVEVEKPVKPGWYWGHFPKTGLLAPVEVRENGSEMLMSIPGTGFTRPVDDYTDCYWWDEPIPCPQRGRPGNMPLFSLFTGSHESEEGFKVEQGYESLAKVLQRALNRAQSGKGKKRHASGSQLPFADQPMFTIVRDLRGGPRMPLFQAMKKIMESGVLQNEQAVNELLDAIIYISASVMLYDGIKENGVG